MVTRAPVELDEPTETLVEDEPEAVAAKPASNLRALWTGSDVVAESSGWKGLNDKLDRRGRS